MFRRIRSRGKGKGFVDSRAAAEALWSRAPQGVRTTALAASEKIGKYSVFDSGLSTSAHCKICCQLSYIINTISRPRLRSAHLDRKHHRHGDDATFRVGAIGKGASRPYRPNVFRLDRYPTSHGDNAEHAENRDGFPRRCQREIRILIEIGGRGHMRSWGKCEENFIKGG